MPLADIHTLRREIDHDLKAGSLVSAKARLQTLWDTQPSSSTAAFIVNRRKRIQELPGVRSCRLAVLRSFTVEPVLPFLNAGALLQGIDLAIHTGGFNSYVQEMLDASGSLYGFAPDVAILAVQTRDIAPALWNDFTRLSPEEVNATIHGILAQIESWLVTFRMNSAAHLIIHNFERPVSSHQGILDCQRPYGQTEAIHELNAGLNRLVRQFQNVYVLDYEGLIGRHGRSNWHDPLRWATVRLPIATSCLQHLAKEWLRFVYALTGQVRKVLVTDLDNTLWGGLAGEDGLSGIQLGDDAAGIGYRNLHRALLDLHRRGVLLAINSKNNEADGLRILEQHPETLLRPEHFAAIRINWLDKAENMRQIASELNVGTDSLVFLDDNPVERERVRIDLPEVEIIELPANPIAYEETLRASVVFERLALTAEDQVRNVQYQEQRGRLELASTATSLEDFYHSLRQVVTVARVEPETLSRAAQLTRKTNQFNLTTKRYTEQQLSELAANSEWGVFTVQVDDRFGDNGIVGVVVTHTTKGACEIDTFLMSCRVIGRTVETAVLAFLAAEAARARIGELRGEFAPTKKNLPAENFFRDHAFTQISGIGPSTYWSLDLEQRIIQKPEWIEMRTAGELVATTYGAR